MSIARDHVEWLSLIEVSGPFVSLPVLMRVFPQGLEKDEGEPELRRLLRMAYDEWADNQGGPRPDPAIHRQWLRFVLANALEMPTEILAEGPAIPPNLRAYVPEHHETLAPDMALLAPDNHAPRLLIKLYPAGQDLNKPLAGTHWKDSPATRMMELLRRTGVRLGLVSNGKDWMLVDAPLGETTGFATWDADIWTEEQVTLRSFRNLLGARRFFGVPDDETIEAMLAESAKNQQEVTEQLGYQVRRAVEVLVQALDRIDKDRGRALLRDVSEAQLYEAALTVMMRLVFLLSAEERGLLALGEPLYDNNYAVSTLQALLREQADQSGEEILERRHDAWSRLLATFRVVFGGVEHQDLRLPAYGGHLFDPDRYPFLEGRNPGTSWRDTRAEPLSINNRTVLHLLEALQFLQVRVQGGGPSERRRLSFRALDVEQIGHVYEGLLDHTARRAAEPMLGLSGSIANESEVALSRLEDLKARDEQALIEFLVERTGRAASAIKNALANSPIPRRFSRDDLRTACENNESLFARVLPVAGLLRSDTFGKPVVIAADSVYVTQGSDRRSTGTHYTPRSLTEPIVQHALDPLVYTGPAEGQPPETWQLRPAAEIFNLKVCDFAMGSGAFLVQVCRYLAEKLVEAWENADPKQEGTPQVTPEGQPSRGLPGETLLPADETERLALAMRLVAEHCLYGVDKNPLAVEMAKLSLWLITLSKNKPFTFLDHALRPGDSLLGVNERQLLNWSMDARPGEVTQVQWGLADVMRRSLETARKLRREIQQLPERDVRDIEAKERKLIEVERSTEIVKLGADLLVVIALADARRRASVQDTLGLDYSVLVKAYEEAYHAPVTVQGRASIQSAYAKLRCDVDALLNNRRPFHWPLEFPEVFATGPEEQRGFDAIVSNPPFQGGSKITGTLGTDYREYLVEYVAKGKRGGQADLCSYFFLRVDQLVRFGGMCGLLATNTIAQGDTREIGLEQMASYGWTIPCAVSSRKWPGIASLEVANIWMKHGNWNGTYFLNESIVDKISTSLTAEETVQGEAYSLIANASKSFKASDISGMGFVLSHGEAQYLIRKDIRNQDVIFPYLNAEDVNSRYDQSPSRWVIDFHDWPLEYAETYSDCMEIVKIKVKPERDKNNRKVYRDRWWQYAEKRPALYAKIANLERVLAIPIHTKHMVCTWESTGIVFSNALCIVSSEADSEFAILQSTFHSDWAWLCGSSLRNDLRYTSGDCYETFAFPANVQGLDDIGERYYQRRQAIMLARQEGLTKTYNRFHDQRETSEDIVQLRALHREMDEAVARAYGWDDLDLGHSFHETKQGLRYTISEEARREVLGRLLRLNHERYAEEVAQGLHEKGAKKAKGKRGAGKRGGADGNSNRVSSGQGEMVFE